MIFFFPRKREWLFSSCALQWLIPLVCKAEYTYLYIKITTLIKAACLWKVGEHTDKDCSWSDPGSCEHCCWCLMVCASCSERAQTINDSLQACDTQITQSIKCGTSCQPSQLSSSISVRKCRTKGCRCQLPSSHYHWICPRMSVFKGPVYIEFSVLRAPSEFQFRKGEWTNYRLIKKTAHL